ncbi:hypothetical protein [Pseudothermotoga sp.]|uniref:hypothetical protein n=1 Tax=Pseudothermotoga sp. TaxID=2033661 RepID=UPI0031F64244
MAYKFKCIDCGAVSYSAVMLRGRKLSRCKKCGGKLLRIQPPMKLGEILIELGFITRKDLVRVLKIQRKLTNRLSLGKLLTKLRLVSQNELERALRIQRSMMSGESVQDIE